MKSTNLLEKNEILARAITPSHTSVASLLPIETLPQKTSAKLLTDDALVALAKLPSNSVDGGVIDPPYGKGVQKLDWDAILPNSLIWAETYRVLKPGAHIAVFCFPDMAHKLAVDLEKAGFEIRNVWVWNYPNGIPAVQPLTDELASRLKPGHEAIVVARKKPDCKTLTANIAKWGTGGLRTHNTLGDGKMSTTIFAYNKPSMWERELGTVELPLLNVLVQPHHGKSFHRQTQRRNNHYCVKPVALLTHLLKVIAKPGDTVIDPFMGSGSAGMAAVWAGMNYIGIDVNPDYVRIAEKRVEYALANPIPERLVPGYVQPKKLPRKKVSKPIRADNSHIDHMSQDRLSPCGPIEVTTKAAGDVVRRKRRSGICKDAVHRLDLLQSVHWPRNNMRLNRRRTSKVRRSLFGSVGLGGLQAQTGHLINGAKQVNFAHCFPRLPSVIGCDQPQQNLFFGSFLGRVFVERRNRRSRCADKCRGRIHPSVGLKYRGADSVMRFNKSGDMAGVIDIPFFGRQRGHLAPSGGFAQPFEVFVKRSHGQVRVRDSPLLAEKVKSFGGFG
jgi:DNA modification methylase